MGQLKRLFTLHAVQEINCQISIVDFRIPFEFVQFWAVFTTKNKCLWHWQYIIPSKLIECIRLHFSGLLAATDKKGLFMLNTVTLSIVSSTYVNISMQIILNCSEPWGMLYMHTYNIFINETGKQLQVLYIIDKIPN